MISRRMLFACAAGIVAGTDARAETTPGSDINAVKTPVTDGSRDVTAAFLDALKTHDRVYVPEGTFRIDSRVDLSRLYGPGILTFDNGHEIALTTPADSETLDQMFFADLKYAVEKVGVQDMDSTLATALRTVVVLVFAWAIVLGKKEGGDWKKMTRRDALLLVLSGITTGASWLCYYRALQDGLASVVVPIDKLSILVTIAFSRLAFHERLTPKSDWGLALIVAGTLAMLL